MTNKLSGTAAFYDDGNSVLLGGRLALSSDGHSRSEIVLRPIESEEEERLVFKTGSTWMPVYHLILVIREMFDSSPVRSGDAEVPQLCPQCDGAGIYEDLDGNWLECPHCSR